MGRQRGDAHRHERPLWRREGPDGGQELIGPGPVDGAQEGATAMGQREDTLAAILRLLAAFHEPAPDQPVDEAARRRR